MAGKRVAVLAGAVVVGAMAAVVGWIAGSKIESPADVAARTAPRGRRRSWSPSRSAY